MYAHWFSAVVCTTHRLLRLFSPLLAAVVFYTYFATPLLLAMISLIHFVQGIIYLCADDESFTEKFCYRG